MDNKISALAFCKRHVPGWRGRKATLRVSASARMLNGLWDGGCRDTFYGINLAGGTFQPPVSGFMSRVPDYVPEPGKVLIEHSIFRGKENGCTVFVHPDDAAKFSE